MTDETKENQLLLDSMDEVDFVIEIMSKRVSSEYPHLDRNVHVALITSAVQATATLHLANVIEEHSEETQKILRGIRSNISDIVFLK